MQLCMRQATLVPRLVPSWECCRTILKSLGAFLGFHFALWAVCKSACVSVEPRAEASRHGVFTAHVVGISHARMVAFGVL